MAVAVKKCFVPSCSNNSERDVNKLFIMVPLKEETQMKWCVAVSRQYTKTKYMYCCEDHFDLEFDMLNWMEHKLIGSRIHMKEDVIPHKFINSPKPTEAFSKSQLSSSTRKRRSQFLENLGGIVKRKFSFDRPSSSETAVSCKQSPETCLTMKKINSPSGKFLEVPINESSEQISSGEHKTDSEIPYFEPPSISKTYCDKKVQVTLKPKRRSICIGTSICVRSCSTNTIDSQKPKQTISISSFSSSESSINNSPSTSSNSGNWSQSSHVSSPMYDMRRSSSDILREKSRFYLGLPKNTYFIVELIEKYVNISSTDILICLKKIRLDDSNSRLADDFGISKTVVSRAIQKNIPLLVSVFNKFIFWQECDTIQALLPIPFRYRYRSVQSIIDCLEIEIPSDPTKQALSWSQYKKCNTVKYLISATPHGFINYISFGFGGRATDKIIVEKSGSLDILPNGAHVMADRGFKQISSLLARKHCELIRPPSVGVSEISSKEEVKEGKRIAALRIHIERVIRRLREFKMLKMHSCVNHKMLHLLDPMIIIACIVNLQNPIIQ